MKLAWFINLLRLGFARVENLTRQIQQRRGLRILINIALVAIVLIFVGSYLWNDWSTIQNIQLKLNPPLILSSLGLYGLNYVIFILAWSLLIKLFSGGYTLIDNALIYSYSQIAKLLPTPAWFIAGRVMLYNREGIAKRFVLIATGLETAIHVWTGLVIFCILSIRIDEPLTLLYSLIILATFFILRAFILFKSDQIQLDQKLRLKSGLALFSFFILTWLTSIPFLNFAIQGVSSQTTIPILEIWKIWIISSIFSYIGTYTLGGFGLVREFSLVFLLERYFSPPVCLVIAVTLRLIMTIGNLVWPGIIIGLIKANQRIAQIVKLQKAP